MTKKLKWRFSKMPTPDEVLKLVNDKIITKEEARDILFNEKDPEVRDESFEEEIKFLRQLVEKLSSNRTTIVETIKEIQAPYHHYHWYKTYEDWCNNGSNNIMCSNNTVLTSASAKNSTAYLMKPSGTGGTSFSEIQTF